MSIIITFDKSRRHPGEAFIHTTRDVGQWMLFLPWFAVIVQWDDDTGGWMVVSRPTPKVDLEMQALIAGLNQTQG